MLGRKSVQWQIIIRYSGNDAINNPTWMTSLSTPPKMATNRAACQRKPVETVSASNSGRSRIVGWSCQVRPCCEPHTTCTKRCGRGPTQSSESGAGQCLGMVEQDTIAPVTTTRPRVTSLVVVPEKDGRLMLCLDPKDLNRAI